jgi:hypothetical protein
LLSKLFILLMVLVLLWRDSIFKSFLCYTIEKHSRPPDGTPVWLCTPSQKHNVSLFNLPGVTYLATFYMETSHHDMVETQICYVKCCTLFYWLMFLPPLFHHHLLPYRQICCFHHFTHLSHTVLVSWSCLIIW